jgi:hypothetical protein
MHAADDLHVVLQFRAISYELWATEDYHMSVRRKAVRHMRWVSFTRDACAVFPYL